MRMKMKTQDMNECHISSHFTFTFHYPDTGHWKLLIYHHQSWYLILDPYLSYITYMVTYI